MLANGLLVRSGIADCAGRAGIKKAAEIKAAVSTAEKAGFLVVHVDAPAVMLTAKRWRASEANCGRIH